METIPQSIRGSDQKSIKTKRPKVNEIIAEVPVAGIGKIGNKLTKAIKISKKGKIENEIALLEHKRQHLKKNIHNLDDSPIRQSSIHHYFSNPFGNMPGITTAIHFQEKYQLKGTNTTRNSSLNDVAEEGGDKYVGSTSLKNLHEPALILFR